MNKRFRHVLMEGEPGAGGGGAPAAAPAAPAAAIPPGAPVVQDKALGTALAPADASAPTALGSGGAADWSLASVPEKYQVKGADGEIDITATFRKVDEHRAQLEKRMGSGDIRPKSPADYKLPENDTFKNLQLEEAQVTGFKAKAHEWGLSQGQYEAVLGEWASLAPKLVEAGQVETVESAVTSLKETWKGDYEANIKESFRAVNRVAESAGIPFDEVEKAIGNNPVAIRMFAALAKEMREDGTPPAANGGAPSAAQSAQEYMAENWAAYSDPKNPKHAAVTQRFNALAEREARRAPAT